MKYLLVHTSGAGSNEDPLSWGKLVQFVINDSDLSDLVWGEYQSLDPRDRPDTIEDFLYAELETLALDNNYKVVGVEEPSEYLERCVGPATKFINSLTTYPCVSCGVRSVFKDGCPSHEVA